MIYYGDIKRIYSSLFLEICYLWILSCNIILLRHQRSLIKSNFIRGINCTLSFYSGRVLRVPTLSRPRRPSHARQTRGSQGGDQSAPTSTPWAPPHLHKGALALTDQERGKEADTYCCKQSVLCQFSLRIILGLGRTFTLPRL